MNLNNIITILKFTYLQQNKSLKGCFNGHFNSGQLRQFVVLLFACHSVVNSHIM